MEGRANEIPPLGTLLHLSNEETNGSVRSIGRTPSWLGIMGAHALSREAPAVYVFGRAS